MEQSWSININQSIPGPRGAALSAALCSTGQFFMRVPANLRGLQEIGVYEYRFSPEIAERLATLVDEIGLWGLPDDFRRAPDEPAVTFYRKEQETVSARVCWPFQHMPPSIEPLISMFHHLVDDARQGPQQVLAGAANWVHPVVRPRAGLELGFRFFNRGVEPIQLQSPRTPVGTSESALTLLLSRLAPAKQGDEDEDEDPVLRIKLLPLALVEVGRGGPTLKEPTQIEHVGLAPGEEARFTAVQGVYLAPGKYRAVLLFDSHTPEPPGPRAPREVGGMPPRPHRPAQDPLRPSGIAGQLAMELPDLTVAEGISHAPGTPS